MIPAPNFVAGVLIGIANTSWPAVVIACFVWPFIFCAYVSILGSARKVARIDHMRTHGSRLLCGSPMLTFYAIEFSTALMTVFVVGSLSYLVSSRSSVGVTHVPWFYFAWTFVLAVITGFALFSRGAVFRRPTGQIIQSILSLLCFGFIGWAFWRLGWKTGLAEVAVIFIGASFGRSLLSYLFRR